ncbi:MAG: 50S ribosomal protein L2 [Deltaproteobacteria bacterium]|nr:50S ribosomal protein L2 [Deltaproteobacteria bacterium]
MLKAKPTSPGRRSVILPDRSALSEGPVEKRLLKGKKRISARNCYGRVTVRWRGGGHKRLYRLIDFKRDKWNVPGKVAQIEYDPNRTAYIALVHYSDGDKRYILAPDGLSVGSGVVASNSADILPGNTLPMECLPAGTYIHNIEMRPGKGGQLVKSAGCVAQLMAKEGDYVLVRLPSGEMRKVMGRCSATVGQVSNVEHNNTSIGKAGRNRWKGRRPNVRGVAMNPVDHPLGGGEGKTSGGRHPCTPWGKPCKGYKTRRNKLTQKFIVRDRRLK